jgi:hypothetical protein
MEHSDGLAARMTVAGERNDLSSARTARPFELTLWQVARALKEVAAKA